MHFSEVTDFPLLNFKKLFVFKFFSSKHSYDFKILFYFYFYSVNINENQKLLNKQSTGIHLGHY